MSDLLLIGAVVFALALGLPVWVMVFLWWCEKVWDWGDRWKRKSRRVT